MAETDEQNNQLEQNSPEDFGSELAADDHPVILSEDVTDKDIFKFGQWTLIACVFIFILVVSTMVYLQDILNRPATAINQVWEYVKVTLNSIVSLVLGFYFGNRKQQR